MVAIAYANAVTPSNIQAGLKSTGIYPFNSQIFSDLDFLPGYVTDHNLLLPAAGEAGTTSNKTPENLLKDQLFGNNEIANSTAAYIEQQPSASSDVAVNPSKQGSGALSSPLFSRSESISPVQVRPFPKVQPRYNNKRKRSRKRKSEILTDSPVKTAIAQAKSSKKVRLPKNIQYNSFYKNNSPTRQKEKRKPTALAKQEWYCLVCMDSYQSINQGFIFSSVTQQIIILKCTHVVEKKESATIRYTLKHAPIQGYKSNYLKMHGR